MQGIADLVLLVAKRNDGDRRVFDFCEAVGGNWFNAAKKRRGNIGWRGDDDVLGDERSLLLADLGSYTEGGRRFGTV